MCFADTFILSQEWIATKLPRHVRRLHRYVICFSVQVGDDGWSGKEGSEEIVLLEARCLHKELRNAGWPLSKGSSSSYPTPAVQARRPIL